MRHVEQLLQERDWSFLCQSFEQTISFASKQSFLYCDPPYIGRNVDYYDSWDEESELALCEALKKSKAKFMLSTWDHNQYRKNNYVDSVWNFCYKITQEHYYYVGAKEKNRNPMVEALLINYSMADVKHYVSQENEQLMFSFV